MVMMMMMVTVSYTPVQQLILFSFLLALRVLGRKRNCGKEEVKGEGRKEERGSGKDGRKEGGDKEKGGGKEEGGGGDKKGGGDKEGRKEDKRKEEEIKKKGVGEGDEYIHTNNSIGFSLI